MLNDASSALSLLRTRRSGRPRDMVAPGPSAEQLESILAIAARTPDHGKLTPWRFVVIADDQRESFAELLVAALAAEDPQAGDSHFDKARQFAHQGAALVVLLSAPVDHPKIPQWEQILSCGAAGMNLLHAVHALGFVGGWLTGWQAYSPTVTRALCEDGERIAGFLFIGTPGFDLVERPRPSAQEVVRNWKAG